jgi:hypothetical protein
MPGPHFGEPLAKPGETFVASNGNVVNKLQWQLANIGGAALKPHYVLTDNYAEKVEECEVAEIVLAAVVPLVEKEAERRGAAKALRQFRDAFDSFDHEHDNAIVAAIADERADDIENGADW